MFQFTKIDEKPWFYALSGILFMVPVIWIARTPWFVFCYFPLIIASIYISGNSNKNKKTRPSKLLRLLGFIGGMVVCELIFSIILITQKELSFQLQAKQTDWIILAIELVLGIVIFALFFGISIVFKYFISKYKNNAGR